jgi:tripartite-type tricarboxylate transporter receptor subunit TctC
MMPWRAGAQDAAYPSRQVKIVVPWPAGGATDVLGRILAEMLSARLGQSFFIENRAGATGYIGTQAVIASPADGYTLLVMAPSLHTFHAAVNKKMPFDSVKDFQPVSAFVQFPSLLVVPTDSKFKSVSDLIADARQRPGKLTFGSFGSGSAAHMIPELLASSTKTQFLHVPYKGAAPAITDLIGGRIDFMIDSMPSPLPHVRGGRLRALAVTSRQRSPLLPDVPTIAETMSDFEAILVIGVGGPAGMPMPIAAKLNEAIRQITQEPSFVEKLANLGAEAASSTSPAAFREFLAMQLEKWTKVATLAKITLE